MQTNCCYPCNDVYHADIAHYCILFWYYTFDSSNCQTKIAAEISTICTYTVLKTCFVVFFVANLYLYFFYSYHHTGLITNIYALREGLSLLVEEVMIVLLVYSSCISSVGIRGKLGKTSKKC